MTFRLCSDLQNLASRVASGRERPTWAELYWIQEAVNIHDDQEARELFRIILERYLERGAPPQTEFQVVWLTLYHVGVMASAMNWALSFVSEKRALHGAIEAYGREWSFGQTEGLYECDARRNHDHVYWRSIPLGVTNLSLGEIRGEIECLRHQWRGVDYNSLSCNCCAASVAISHRLGTGWLPPWINSLAESLSEVPGADTLLGRLMLSGAVSGSSGSVSNSASKSYDSCSQARKQAPVQRFTSSAPSNRNLWRN